MTPSPAGARPASPGSAARLLPGGGCWLFGSIAAILLFLAVLALAAATAADRAASRWAGGVAETATLSVITEEAELESQARAALAILRETPGVRAVHVLEPAEQRSLLAPYLGTGIAFDASTLPLMMQIETDRAVLDRSALDARLSAEAPGAVFDDHTAWRLPLAAAAQQERNFAAAGSVLLVLALAAAAAMAARNAAATAHGTLRTLKSLGMPDARLRLLLLLRVGRALAVGGGLGALAATLLAGGIEPEPAAAGFGLGFSGWTWVLPALALAAALLLGLAVAALAIDRVLRMIP